MPVPIGTPLCIKCNKYATGLNPEGKCRICAKTDKSVRRHSEFTRRAGNFFNAFGNVK